MPEAEQIITFDLLTEEERQNWRKTQIEEIKSIIDELAKLQIYAEPVNFDLLPDLDLIEEVEAHRDWLKRRKEFSAWMNKLKK